MRKRKDDTSPRSGFRLGVSGRRSTAAMITFFSRIAALDILDDAGRDILHWASWTLDHLERVSPLREVHIVVRIYDVHEEGFDEWQVDITRHEVRGRMFLIRGDDDVHRERPANEWRSSDAPFNSWHDGMTLPGRRDASGQFCFALLCNDLTLERLEVTLSRVNLDEVTETHVYTRLDPTQAERDLAAVRVLDRCVDMKTARERMVWLRQQATLCDMCERPLEQFTYIVGGRVWRTLDWGYFCPECFFWVCEGIGFGDGHLYARQSDGKLLMVGGFPSIGSFP